VKDYKLSTNDICKLISTCKKNGVIEFTFGELHLSLASPEKARKNEAPQAAIPDETFLKEQEQEFRRIHKMDQDKDDTAMLLVEDPLEMERRIANGELADEDTND